MGISKIHEKTPKRLTNQLWSIPDLLWSSKLCGGTEWCNMNCFLAKTQALPKQFLWWTTPLLKDASIPCFPNDRSHKSSHNLYFILYQEILLNNVTNPTESSIKLSTILANRAQHATTKAQVTTECWQSSIQPRQRSQSVEILPIIPLSNKNIL